MDNSRRDFLKKAALIAGSTGAINAFPLSIRKAMAINPEPGTTFEDAEHVVLLMQENRSFDHVFGSLQGIRGFNDPRAIDLPNKNKVWLQTDYKGDVYAPYRLDIKDSKVTWIGGLPHQWGDQVDARNNGRYDKWLEAKRHGDMPFTMGYYTREDLPFYYALADAFTVCDHHFCSSLTGTTPNRLYYWTGTIREKQNGESPANVENYFVNYSHPAHWKTFPEELEEKGISWKIYQNEISVGVGLHGEAASWLENFTDNPIEWFSQYHVRFHPAHVSYMKERAATLKKEIANLPDDSEEKEKRQRLLKKITEDLKKYNIENFKKLPEREQNLHKKAFTTNVNDPLYHEMTTLDYEENGIKRQMALPKSDALFQFREDVKNGRLPTVSWLVGSQRFSDHPSSPWFGALYVSEVLDILTQNPEVWKKTIFILCYDENDGYYDHLPPFTAPNPEDRTTGFCSAGIDTTVDFVTKTQEERQSKEKNKAPGRVSPIGLGYRIPFVVASPWSRGGKVNSQVSDNTSVLMFLEKFLSKKTGKKVEAENISAWRRAICGDITSVFTPYNGEEINLPEFIKKKPFVEEIYNAKFKHSPEGYRKLTQQEIDKINAGHSDIPIMARQEKGTRTACPLPYELYVHGKLNPHGKFEIEMNAAKEVFGKKAAGAPFYIYNLKDFSSRNYAVKSGDSLRDQWEATEGYHLKLYGPNGFFREFKGSGKNEDLTARCTYERKRLHHKKLSGNAILELAGGKGTEVEITDNAYGQKAVKKRLGGKPESIILNLKKSRGWYDFTVRIKDRAGFLQRFAGHIETGEASVTDPYMGRAETG